MVFFKLPKRQFNGSSYNDCPLFNDAIWLGGRDSNPDSQIQSLESYHWTTSQQRNRIYVSQPVKSTARHFAFLTLTARTISCDVELSLAQKSPCAEAKVNAK